jgi:hypothetical protein
MSFRTQLTALLTLSTVIAAPSSEAGRDSQSLKVTPTLKPLHIAGKVLRAGELPGFVPKQCPATVTSVAAWNKVAPSGGIDVEARS